MSSGSACGSGGGGGSDSAQNIGNGSIIWFKQKSASTFQFYSMTPSSPLVYSIANDTIFLSCPSCLVATTAYTDPSWLSSVSWSKITGVPVTGNGSKVVTSTGTTPTSQCATWDASGNLIGAGASCGGSGGSGETNTASNVGLGGIGLYLQKVGVDLQFKSIAAASNRLSVVNNAGNRQIDLDLIPANLDLATLGGSLQVSQISAAGRAGNGTLVQMRGAGTPATDDCAKFDANGNIISAGAACGSGGGGSGEVNTASNVGSSGVGVYDSKSTYDLRFRKINPASNKLSVTLNSQQIDLDLIPGNWDISAIGGSLVYSQIASASRQGSTGTKVQMFGGGSVSTNDCVKFDSSGNIVSSGAPCSSALQYSATASSSTTWTIAGTTHNLGTCYLSLVTQAVSGATATWIAPDSASCNTSTYDVTITWATAQAGRFALFARGGGGGGGGSATPGGSAGQIQVNLDGVSLAGRDLGFGLRFRPTTLELEVNPSSVPTYLTAVGSLNFSSISANACSELTFTLSGAAVGDSVAPGLPATLEAGLVVTMFVSASDTITTRACKVTTGSVDPALQNFRATIVRSF